ncbi:MAG TPA: hypothetical protein DCR40_16280 [Prolixibacteraceae bacterium]|nr:hypothetical protein [Prolixibacteraceae bacterium]
MKKNSIKLFALLLVFGLTHRVVLAQPNRESEIRNLENMERQAVLKRDTTLLFNNLWSPEMVVNTPANRVGTVEGTKASVRMGKLDYATFDRFIEKITFTENIAIVMGKEILQPQGLSDHVGKIVTRRFTNVWMITKEGWQMVARHATIINVE